MLAASDRKSTDNSDSASSRFGFLDALLAATPETDFDDGFLAARKHSSPTSARSKPATRRRLSSVNCAPISATARVDELPRVFGFGGCLADDMGLGKNRAGARHARSRRENADARVTKPTLVVVPRSLVFNWKQESEKFPPRLKLLDHSGGQRAKTSERFGDYDVHPHDLRHARLDVIHLKDFAFDYVILDEAQAIKETTLLPKPPRPLRAAQGGPPAGALRHADRKSHRRNSEPVRIPEPGMLGRSSMLNVMSGPTATKDIETRRCSPRSLRPFILRRTKEQVASDLPEKLEQTITCELEPDQRKLYDELRNHYRTSLLDRVAKKGSTPRACKSSKPCCGFAKPHAIPDSSTPSTPAFRSAKLDELIPRLAEAVDEGHKVLVFSQFTSFLAIVQEKLKEQNLIYEYLDGKTRDRPGARRAVPERPPTASCSSSASAPAASV